MPRVQSETLQSPRGLRSLTSMFVARVLVFPFTQPTCVVSATFVVVVLPTIGTVALLALENASVFAVLAVVVALATLSVAQRATIGTHTLPVAAVSLLLLTGWALAPVVAVVILAHTTVEGLSRRALAGTVASPALSTTRAFFKATCGGRGQFSEQVKARQGWEVRHMLFVVACSP